MVYRPRVLPWSTERGVLSPCVQVVCTRSCVQGSVYRSWCTGRVYKAECTGHVYRPRLLRSRVQSRVYRRGIQVVVYRPRVLKLRVQITCSNRIAMPCHRAPMRTIPDSVGLSLRHHCHPAVLARLAHRSWSNSLALLTWPNARKCPPKSHLRICASPRPRYSAHSSIHAACDWSTTD